LAARVLPVIASSSLDEFVLLLVALTTRCESCKVADMPVMTNDFTAVYQEAEEGGYIAYAEEVPGAITQGETLEEARANLAEAIQLVLETNREQHHLELADGRLIRETIKVTRS
jgi:predicted RNase H-like HicB family nuclease